MVMFFSFLLWSNSRQFLLQLELVIVDGELELCGFYFSIVTEHSINRTICMYFVVAGFRYILVGRYAWRKIASDGLVVECTDGR